MSSTFTDTERERNALMKEAFPLLEQLCHILHLQFETVDMRWGVREFTNDSHGTSALCIKELLKCNRISRGPAFVCILGNKYGYRPFPPTIPQHQLDKMWDAHVRNEEIRHILNSPNSAVREVSSEIVNILQSHPLSEVWENLSDHHRKLLAEHDLLLVPRWFPLDLNAGSPEYCLRTITELIPDFRPDPPDEMKENLAKDRWWKIFDIIQRELRDAARKALAESEQEPFVISVTEEEVHNGVFLNKKKDTQSICFLREIVGIEDLVHTHPGDMGKFVDLKWPKRDEEAGHLLNVLKERTARSLFHSCISYTVWKNDLIAFYLTM